LNQVPNHELIDVDGLARSSELAHLHALSDEEEQKAHVEPAIEQRKRADHDVGDRRREVRLQLFLRDREDVTH
jgi:hypothetical protein